MLAHRRALGVLIAATLLLAACAGPDDRTKVTVFDDPATGTRIQRVLASGQTFHTDNRTYDQLTPEEKESLNRNYEHMGPGDEPPFPAEGLEPVYVAIIRAHRHFKTEGKLVLFATVDPEGNVAKVEATGDVSSGMKKAAATIVTLTKFKPALCKGTPCKMDFSFHMTFSRDHN